MDFNRQLYEFDCNPDSGSKQIYFRDFFEEIEFLSVKQGNYRAWVRFYPVTEAIYRNFPAENP